MAGADIVITSYALFRIDYEAYASTDLGRAGAGRGPVREEPPVQGLPVRPQAAGRLQAGHHRHAAGEQPDGVLGADLHRGAGAVLQPQAVRRVLPEAGGEERRQGAAGQAPPSGPAAHDAPHQGAGHPGPAAQAGADPGGGAEPAAPEGLPDAPAARTPEDPGPDRRRQQEPLHHLPVADAAAAAQPGCVAGGSVAVRRPVQQARRAVRTAGGPRGRRPPGADLQPVHRLPGQGPGAARRGEHRVLLPRRRHPEPYRRRQ